MWVVMEGNVKIMVWFEVIVSWYEDYLFDGGKLK